MKSLHILFLFAMLITLVIAKSAEPHKGSPFFTSFKSSHNSTKNSNKYGRGHMACDKYPRVCRVKGSEGHDCCRKKCVNVSTDRNNCGECGKRCKYSETCCKGKCLNTMFNKHHCGRCGIKCDHGKSCVYGICNYA